MNIEQQIDLITELTLKLKEKQGTERKEVHALIDKTIRELVSEARIAEVMALDWRSMGGNRDTEDYFDEWQAERIKELTNMTAIAPTSVNREKDHE